VDGGNSLPLDTLAPDAWINRWFDRRTWDSMTAIRETLHAPIACIDFSTFNLLMECDGRAVEELDSGNNRVLTNKEREPGYRITPRHTHTIPPWNPTELAEKYRNYWYWLRERLRQHGTLPNRYKQPHGNASDLVSIPGVDLVISSQRRISTSRMSKRQRISRHRRNVRTPRSGARRSRRNRAQFHSHNTHSISNTQR
jgi:hypothetical protein